MSIGSRIKELRIKRGLTQEELARQIGVTKGAVANYENEVSSPKIELMYKLFDVLQCDANYLHQDDMKSNVYRDSSTPEEFENIIKKYRALDEHGKDIVDIVLEKESERMAQLQKTDAPAPAATVPVRVIQYYQRLASAGSGQIVFDGVPVEQLEIPDRQEYRRVSYAVGVNGQSMEPLYKDGDILLIEPTCQLEQGEVGIFIVGNNAYVKKLGETELISVNKDYKNIPLTEDTKCMGRVVDKL